MKKICSCILVAFFTITSLFPSTTIKFGYSTTSTDPRGIAAKLFKDEVEKKSKGMIKVDIYDNAKLGSDTALIEGVISGTVDMTVSSAGNFAVYAVNIGISALPFLFTDFNKAWKFMDSKLVSEINKDLEAYNIVVLSHFDNGFRCVTTSEKPIDKVSDMKDLKIRVPANQIVMATMTILGAHPEPLAFGELYAALKAKKFDGQENPIPVIYNNKLYEVQKYLSITNHSYDAMPLVIRKDLWDKFSADEKKIISDAAKKAQDLNRKIVKDETNSLVATLQKEGMEIIKPDLKEFAKATKSVNEMFEDIYGEELVQQVQTFK